MYTRSDTEVSLDGTFSYVFGQAIKHGEWDMAPPLIRQLT